MHKRTYFKKKTNFHQNNFTPEITYSKQASKVSIKRSAFRCTPERPVKAYAKQFLALLNAMYSHRVYL